MHKHYYLSPIFRRKADLVFSVANSSIGQFPDPSNYQWHLNKNKMKIKQKKNIKIIYWKVIDQKASTIVRSDVK